MPLLVALALLALACAPQAPPGVLPDASGDAPEGALSPQDGPSADSGRTDAAEGSVPDTLSDAPVPRDTIGDATPLCPAGMVWCGAFCSALDTLANCGACGRTCGSNQRCGAGGCRCEADFADCDGDAANGCEVRVTSPATCGGCGGATCPAMYACSSLETDAGRRFRCCPNGPTGASCRAMP